MPATLLLAATAAVSQYPILSALFQELWVLVLAFIGTIVSVVIYLRKDREEKQQRLAKQQADEKEALNARIKKMEEELHNNSLKHMAAQQEREKLVDAYQLRIGHLETKVSQVDTIASKVNLMETRLEVQNTLITSMNTSIADMKADSKAQFNEVLYILKEKRHDK